MVTNVLMPLALLALQPQPLRAQTNAVQFSVMVGLFLLVVIVVMYFVFKMLKPRLDQSSSEQLRQEFEQSKEALLLAAQTKKAEREAADSAGRQADADQRERELLRENVDPESAFGQTCPLCGLEMMSDQDLVIDPYTGQAYHFSSFINDWPAGQPRPKYVYRYPQHTVVNSENLTRNY
jgi:hypothetical protein